MPYIGHSPEVAQRRYESIDDISGSFNGSTTSFALQVGGVTPAPFPVASENVLISVGGVIQEPDGGGTNGFQLTGTNIVFSSAPNSGQSFFGVILAGADYVTAGHAFPDGDAGNPSITFSQDLDSGLFRSGAGTTSVSANNNKIADFGPSEIVFNEDGDDVDFRVEGDTKANLFVVDAGNDKITLDGDLEPTTIHGETFPTAGALSSRNLIINGDCRISQRGTTFAIGTGAVAVYTVDRFRLSKDSGGAFTVTQESDGPAGFNKSIKVATTTASTPTSAGNFNILQYNIEGQDLQHLNYGTSDAKTTTLSFYVKSNMTGNLSVTSEVNTGPPYLAGSVEIQSVNTWEYKTITFIGNTATAIDDDNTTGIEFQIWLDAGSNFSSSGQNTTSWNTDGASRVNSTNQINLMGSTSNYIQFTGFQYELGEKATPFEHRSISDELARCQRYYQQFSKPRLRGVGGSTTALNRLGLTLPVTMRAAPTITSSNSFDWYDGDGVGTFTGFSVLYPTIDSVEVDASVATGSTTIGRAIAVYNGTQTGILKAAAEL